MQKKNLTLHAAALLLGALALAACEGRESSATPLQPQRRVPVAVVAVTPATVRDVLTLPGTTEAWEDVVVAADASGRVEWMGPREGERVRKGELLAKIDVAALKARLDHAQASFHLADEQYGRRRSLRERHIIAQEDLDRSETQRTLALKDLEQARVMHERGFPRAPIEGVINRRFVEAGEFIETGKPLVNIVNIGRIKINAQVPEMDIRFIQRGQKTPLTIDALPGLALTGTVDFVAFKADPATKTFLVRTVVDNPDNRIRPGMIGRTAFLRRVIPEAVTAPLFALVDKSGERVVFVARDGVAESRTVGIGVIEGDRVQIVSGLAAGELLIVKGQTEVEDGTRVGLP
jgi:membrane fusion protein (multidrug efflux system)